jgi:hypothetical protein
VTAENYSRQSQEQLLDNWKQINYLHNTSNNITTRLSVKVKLSKTQQDTLLVSFVGLTTDIKQKKQR